MTRGAAIMAGSLALAVSSVLLAQAATSGIAYDSFTRTQMGGNSDLASIDPVPFDPAFEAASKSQLPTKINPFQLGKMAQQTSDFMKNGTATRQYFLGSKQRTDDVSANTHVVIDCAAGTRTTFDDSKKTYRVESLFATPAPSGQTPGPRGTPPPDDGTRYTVKVTTRALGPKTIETVDTQGFLSDVSMTTTKTDGQTSNMDMATKMFVSGYATPQLVCPRAPIELGERGGPSQAGAGYTSLMHAVMGKDKRFTITSSGPPLPSGKLTVFDAMQPSMGGQGKGGMTIVTQNGHIRQLTDADSGLFGIPAGYTQEATR